MELSLRNMKHSIIWYSCLLHRSNSQTTKSNYVEDTNLQ